MNTTTTTRRRRTGHARPRMLTVPGATVDFILERAGIPPRPAPAAPTCVGGIGFDPRMPRVVEALVWTSATNLVRSPARTWLLDDYRAFPIILVDHDPARPIGRCLRVHHCPLGLHALVEFAPCAGGYASWRDASGIGWSTTYTNSGDGRARLHDISATWSPASTDNRTLQVSQARASATPTVVDVWAWATGREQQDWERIMDEVTRRDLVRLAVRHTYRVLGRNPTVILPGTRAAPSARVG